MTVRVLQEAGLRPNRLRSKSVDEYLGQRFDYVITVCDDSRGVCPVFPGVARVASLGLSGPGEGRRDRGRASRGVPTSVHEPRRADPPVPADRGALRRGAPVRSPDPRAPYDRDRMIALHLLRHAHAGDATRWSGDDDVRPLSEKGIRQAERLGRLLSHVDDARTCSSRRRASARARRRRSWPRRSASVSSWTNAWPGRSTRAS